jgi:membrane-associated protein
MEQIYEFFHFLTDSEDIIQTGGLLAITLIVFAENGLFFAFFLPGDYLLFLTGVFGGTQALHYPLWVLLICLFTAAIIGSFVGYLFGRFFGSSLENRKDSFFFKKKNIDATNKYFEKYGARTLIISRFLPIVRTFAPILAGISKMRYDGFLLYNIIGGALWVGSLVSLGFYLGNRFPQIIHYVPYIIFFFLAITTFTVIKGYFNARKEFK